MSSAEPAAVQALLAPWSGPCGGLPPFDQATPPTIAAAYEAAIALKRVEIRRIADNPEPATFDNTLAALEDSGRALARLQCLLGVFTSTMSTGDMPATAQRLAPLLPALNDEIAHDEALFARVDAVWRTRREASLTAPQQRLAEVLRDRMLRGGAGLPPAGKTRLAAINGRLAEAMTRFNQNLIVDQDTGAVFLDDEACLDGLDDGARQVAAAAAAARGQPGRWAVTNTRPAVWPFLTHATRRDLREQVWRMWASRGDHAGPHDNKPLMAEILRRRGEKARLLGYPSYAHLATADRMAGTPEAAMAVLKRAWDCVIDATRAQIVELQAIADADADGGASIRLAPWDRLFYAEKSRRQRFGLDGDAVKPYLRLDAVLQALFWSAGRLHGLTFTERADVPVVHPSCRVFEVGRGGEPVGALYFDLLQRPGKMHGSYQSEYRAAESFDGRVLPISSINSSLAAPADGAPVLLPWEYANVLFHEFGHALHMLCNQAVYPSLGSMGVAWDLIELPALLNERWLLDRELLGRFARHHATGAPMPPSLIDRIERATTHDRIFSLNLDYLAPAIVDMRMHLLADGAEGREIDASRVEEETLRELGMPEAWDLIMRVPHSFHSFVGAYAAGVYVYLWADLMAADVAEAFLQSAGGLYDAAVAERYRQTLLGVGNSVPAAQAFREFRGRDPDPDALLRRFGLSSVNSEPVVSP